MTRAPWLLVSLALSSLVAGSLSPRHAAAQERPRPGGELVLLVPSEPPSYDGHREGTFGTVHPLAPLYNTLLRIDPTDRTGTRPAPDLAESWTITPDGLTYTFKLRAGVRFHDGAVLSSRDVKASYDKIIFPPSGIISARKGAYQAVEAVEAPDPLTVRFRLKWPEASFLVNLSSPFNWIYRADILARDMRWYETNTMGTGPFKFVEHVKGSHLVGKKNADYWDKGKPYLDGYRAVFISASAAQVAAIRGERARAVPRLHASRARQPRASPRAQDHRAGEPVGLPLAGGHQPRAQAVRRQARAARSHPGPRPLGGLEEPLADRRGPGSGRHPGPRHPVGHAAPGTGEARRLRTRHPEGARGGAATPPRGRRARRLLLHVQEPRHPHAVRAGGHLAHRSVAADRTQREAGGRGGSGHGLRAPARRLRGRLGRPVQLRGRARHRRGEVPVCGHR